MGWHSVGGDRLSVAARIRELVAQCPRCLCFETLDFRGSILIPTLKFKQKEGGKVYHDCGSQLPCRLFPRFIGESPLEGDTKTNQWELKLL